MIMPGYRSFEDASLWTKNNRVAELGVTLNGERTFSVKIPDEKFSQPYPVVVRDYVEPVKTVSSSSKRCIAAPPRAIPALRICG